jgi:WD40 repeat protein
VAIAAVSPDGRWIASGSQDALTIWDAAAGTVSLTLPPVPALRRAVFSADSKRLAAASPEDVRVWSVPEGTEVFTRKPGPVIGDVDLSPDGKRLALGLERQPIEVWDVAARSRVCACKAQPRPFVRVRFSPDGRQLATSGDGGVLGLCDAGTGELLQSLGVPSEGDHWGGVAFSPDGRRLAAGILRPPVGQRVESGEQADGRRLAAGILKPLAAGTLSAHIYLWDLSSHPPKPRKLTSLARFVTGVVFSPDGKTLASPEADGQLLLSDVATGQKLREWRMPGLVNEVAFARDGRHLVTANGNGTVSVIRLGPPGWRPAVRPPGGE